MTDIAVEPARIKVIRKARKIGRPKLAKLSGLTERKLAKLETLSAAALDQFVVQRLSDALQVPVPALTGEYALSEDDLYPAATHKCTSGCCG